MSKTVIERRELVEGVIVIHPKVFGLYGYKSIHRAADEIIPIVEKALEEELGPNCVDSVHSEPQVAFLDGGVEYDSLFDALSARYGFEADNCYTYRHKRSKDDIFSTGTVWSFQGLAEAAYDNPREFEVTSAFPELTDEQKEFLQAILNEQVMAKFSA